MNTYTYMRLSGSFSGSKKVLKYFRIGKTKVVMIDVKNNRISLLNHETYRTNYASEKTSGLKVVSIRKAVFEKSLKAIRKKIQI